MLERTQSIIELHLGINDEDSTNVVNAIGNRNAYNEVRNGASPFE